MYVLLTRTALLMEQDAFAEPSSMKLNSERFREILAGLGPKPAVFTRPPDGYREWLVEKRVPPELVKFLVDNALGDIAPFPNGCGSMWTPDGVMAFNTKAPELLGCGLFAIGSAVNGDYIVIDVTPGTDRAGFVCHAEYWHDFWEHPEVNVRKIFIPVDNSIHELLTGMSDELHGILDGTKDPERPDAYPTDYYAAEERQQS